MCQQKIYKKITEGILLFSCRYPRFDLNRQHYTFNMIKIILPCCASAINKHEALWSMYNCKEGIRTVLYHIFPLLFLPTVWCATLSIIHNVLGNLMCQLHEKNSYRIPIHFALNLMWEVYGTTDKLMKDFGYIH
jgi:hypothetical protein